MRWRLPRIPGLQGHRLSDHHPTQAEEASSVCKAPLLHLANHALQFLDPPPRENQPRLPGVRQAIPRCWSAFKILSICLHVKPQDLQRLSQDSPPFRIGRPIDKCRIPISQNRRLQVQNRKSFGRVLLGLPLRIRYPLHVRQPRTLAADIAPPLPPLPSLQVINACATWTHVTQAMHTFIDVVFRPVLAASLAKVAKPSITRRSRFSQSHLL